MNDYHAYPIHEALAPIKDQMHIWWPASKRGHHSCVPSEHAGAIADFVTNVVAELIESYLNAGSERDAIAEDLYEAILSEVKDWTEEVV